MTQNKTTNLAASIHQRLLNLSQKRNENFNILIGQFAIERFLYRLAQSRFADHFVLKGALLFSVWQLPVHRPTRDIDLLGFGDNSAEILAGLFADVCHQPVADDGLLFDAQSIQIKEIREDQAYGGQRVTLMAKLGNARLPLQIDVGFGDIVSPGPVETEYPTLLAFPAPRLHIYSKESVIAEKLHAMVVLDLTNSRMKDFYDLWILARLFAFDGATLAQAIQATFARRQTAMPAAPPTALTGEFATNGDKIKQWQAFLNRSQLDVGDVTFGVVIAALHGFLWPPLAALTTATVFSATWPAGGQWR